MIFIAGMSIAVFFEFLLLSKKNKTESDKILALWMFLIAVHLFLFYVSLTGEIYNYTFLLGVNMPLPLLHGVFLYLYVGSVTNQLPGTRSLLLIHFVPAVAMYLYLVTFFVLPGDQKIWVYKNNGAGHEVFGLIRHIAVGLSGIVYVTWSSLLLRTHRRRILDEFSYQDKIDLRWLQILTWGIGCIWLLILARNDSILFGGVTVFVFLIGFFGIRQVRILVPERQSAPEQEEKEKYAKSGLTPELSEKLYGELIHLMNEETVYTKNDLSVDDLASRLKVHPNYLSQVINEKEGKNFYDFVNTYRIEKFKRLIADPRNRHLTLLSLAFDCGFNSKSSFNRYFKKSTGQTPSEYFDVLTTAQRPPSA
ncbi:MAG TPA: helix-turn-helix domain-containing protein [Bacteroidota bacterium]